MVLKYERALQRTIALPGEHALAPIMKRLNDCSDSLLHSRSKQMEHAIFSNITRVLIPVLVACRGGMELEKHRRRRGRGSRGRRSCRGPRRRVPRGGRRWSRRRGG
uniref:Uncharacterized protein n=1 Tax=Arundo donax TaxID=35708 RepID=A0A0A9AZZ2_ARUDO